MTRVRYFKKFPQSISRKNSLVIVDHRLRNLPWIKKFKHQYVVRSGETLKDLHAFPKHMEKILQLVDRIEARPVQIVAIGGGSVGDFAGFVASVLKRGVPLIQVPSTWLAAMDSAHGGKNALNSKVAKNQIGTIYMAQEVWMIESLLGNQPPERAKEAMGEAIKMAFLTGSSLAKKMKVNLTSKDLWKLLPALVAGKNQIVRRDPKETKGVRHLLNLGHTVGHVLESQLKIPHGRAVLLGLQFSIRWSIQKGLLGDREVEKIASIPIAQPIFDISELQQGLRRLRNPENILIKDKKRTAGKNLRFIFLKGLGKPIIKTVSLKDLMIEMRRQAR